jgi:putative transcriptional regulator
MTERALELLPEYVLGTLADEDVALVERALAESPDLVAEMRAISDAYETLAMSLPAVEPRPDTKARLLSTLAENRFLPFADELSRYFDLAVEKMRQILRLIDDVTAWEPGPMPGVELIHFQGGPNAFAPDTGFVRFPAGSVFPEHDHKGPELTYVLSGSFTDSDGRSYGPGDVLIKSPGHPHSLQIGDEDCIIAIAHVDYALV